MTRIIAGALGSMRLKGPAKSTRPTSDRVKESLFSILESMDAIKDSRVLDLYAGTGALGLEAASRGAASVTFVESDSGAGTVCRANIELAKEALQKNGLNSKLQLVSSSAKSFLKRGQDFNLVFLDPPYDLSNEELKSQLESISNTAEPLLVVIERSSKSLPLAAPDGFQEASLRNYGDTVLYFLIKGFVQ